MHMNGEEKMGHNYIMAAVYKRVGFALKTMKNKEALHWKVGIQMLKLLAPFSSGISLPLL